MISYLFNSPNLHSLRALVVSLRLALLFPRPADAQSVHRLVSGRGRGRVPQSVFTSRNEQRRMRTKLLLGVLRRHQSSRSRITPTRAALTSLLQHRHQAARSSAPCGTRPVSTKRQRAINSLRASATMPTFAARPPLPLKRSRYQQASSLPG